MRQNLILITIDCLRADHCGFMGYTRPTTPTLDELARQSIVFENAQVAGVPTYYSFPAIMASRYPLSLGRDVLGVPSFLPTLATVLRAAGYRTAGFNAGNQYLARWFGYDQGLETYEDCGLTPPSTRVNPATESSLPFYRRVNRWLARVSQRLPGARELYRELDLYYCYLQERKKYAGVWEQARRYPHAAEMTQRALAWLQAQTESPFFLWLHYMDPHYPRYPSPAALAALGVRPMNLERQFFLNNRVGRLVHIRQHYCRELIHLYDAGIRDVDDQIRVLLQAAPLRLTDHPTTIVVLGDHGEELFEQGRFGHSPPQLYQSLLHVPLIIQAPQLARRIRAPFGLIDLAPTLLEMLGLAAPPSFQGTSRWDALINQREWSEPAIAEIAHLPHEPRPGDHLIFPRLLAVRQADYKLILDLATGTDTLYHLATDPAEQHPLALTSARAMRRQLLLAAREHLRRTRVRQDEPLRLRARLANLRQRLERESTQPR